MKIKEVMERTGLTDRAIRLYIANDLVCPSCTASYSGRKNFEFGEADVEALQKIALLRKADFSIEQIKLLQKGGAEAWQMLCLFLEEKRSETARGYNVIEALESLNATDEINVDTVCERITLSFDAEELPAEDSALRGLSLQCPYCHKVFGGSPWCPNCKQSPFPMKWYKFLIYFWLFLSAALYIYNGFTCLAVSTNSLYNSRGSVGVAVVDLIYSFLFFGLAVLALVTRFRLADYKMNAPTLVTTFFIAEAVIQVSYPWVYYIASWGQYGGFSAFSAGSSLVFYAVVAILNFYYFNKRVEVFVY